MAQIRRLQKKFDRVPLVREYHVRVTVFVEQTELVWRRRIQRGCSFRGPFKPVYPFEGDGLLVQAGEGDSHRLNYAETIVIPAAVGRYALRRMGDGPVRVVKALVR